jgi:hypothetical protein
MDFEGNVYQGLSALEAMKLKQADLEKRKQFEQQSNADARLGPALNQQIGQYMNQQGTEAIQQIIGKAPANAQPQPEQATQQAQPQQQSSYAEPSRYSNPDRAAQGGRAPVADSVMSAMDNLKSSQEDTTELEAMLNGMSGGQSQKPSNVQLPAIPESPMSGLQAGVDTAPGTQPQQTAFNSLLEGIPFELVKDILFEYHQGNYSPSKLLSEIKKARKEMFDINTKKEEMEYQAKLSEQYRKDTANDGLGASGPAARLNFTRQHPEMVDAALQTINSLRTNGKYDQWTLETLENLSKIDIVTATTRLNELLGKTAGAVRTLDETLPGEIRKTYATSAAGVQGKESAEQGILTGTTIPGLKPIQGIRQTDKSIETVKTARPSIETLRKSTNDLINKYNEVGWKPIGKDAAELKQLVRIVQLFSKESSSGLFNLGVLNGPDLGLLEEIINNPGSFKDGAKMLRYGKEKYGATFQNFKDLVDYKTNLFYKTNGFQEDTSAGAVAGTTGNTNRPSLDSFMR